MRDFTVRVEIPELRKQAAVYRQVGPSYLGVNPEGTKRWIEIEEHAQQPGAPSPKCRMRSLEANPLQLWRGLGITLFRC
jgi:hypothetical protein